MRIILLLLIACLLLAGCVYNGPGAACAMPNDCSFGLACVDGACQPDTGGVQNATQTAFEQSMNDKDARALAHAASELVPAGSKRFTVTVPSFTPVEDVVWVEFDWANKAPLQRVSAYVWSGVVPVPITAKGYAYSRNGIGFEASDVIGPQETQENFYYHRSLPSGDANDTVTEWRWWTVDPATFTSHATLKPFLARAAGVEFQDGVAVIDFWWDVFYENGETPATISEITGDNVGWVEYTPTWVVEDKGDSVTIDYNCGYCYPDKATRFETNAAKAAGLNVIWRTQIWQAEDLVTTGRSEAWWHSLSAANREWILHNAQLAEELGVAATTVGAEYSPLTRAVLSDDAPVFVHEEWLQAVKDVRTVYSGKLYYDLNNNAPVDARGALPAQYARVKDIISETDFIGVSWWQDISDNCDPTTDEMEKNFGEIADAELKPIYDATGKPVVLISLAIPSVDCGSRGNSLYEYDDRSIDIWKYDNGVVANDMLEQARAYDAVMRAIADRPWITGVYSFGYWRHDSQDKQWNIRGKEAQKVLREWYGII